MKINLAQALGILVQSAQSHLDGNLLTNENDMILLKESINLLLETEKKLEKENSMNDEKSTELNTNVNLNM